jgi:ElaB/YqjD/DUF883 family membrane-anchored ribosome-binding protein
MSSTDKPLDPVDETDAAADSCCETAEKWREAAADCCAAGAEQVRNATQTIEDFVRRQPVTSLLIAAGVGFVAALFVTRRK